MNRFADGIVAAEREGDIAHAAADQGIGQVLLDPARGLNIGKAVFVMLFKAGGNGEDIRV